MRSQRPLVSIGLPVYNGENFVSDAITCVLSQTFSDWELIISDNASTDRTLTICRAFAERDSRIRVYRNPRNMGFAPNYNRVFHLSRGRYFKWIAHDDLFSPDVLTKCVAELEKDSETVLVFPQLEYVDQDGRLLRRQTSSLNVVGRTPESRASELIRLEAQGTDIYWCQFGLIRRNVLASTTLIGCYNGSDQVLLFDLALRGNFKQLETEAFFRREHPASSTVRRGWTGRERAIFAYADDRRRFVFPYCRMLKEHFVCIWRSSLPFWRKLRCMTLVLKRFGRQWKYFAHEMIESPLEAIRARRSIEVVLNDDNVY